MLQGQLKHLGGAAQQAHAQAVQNHPLAALERRGAEVPILQAADEPAEAGGDIGPSSPPASGHGDPPPPALPPSGTTTACRVVMARRHGCCETTRWRVEEEVEEERMS